MSLAAIHIRKKELGLSDAAYRSLLCCVAGVRSAKDLTPEGDRAVMRALYEMHEHPVGNLKKTSKKIWAAWYDLRQYLPAGKRSCMYLCGIARKNAPGISVINGNLDFDPIPDEQADLIIRSLINAANHAKAQLADVPF